MNNLPVYNINDFHPADGSFYANDLATHLKEHEFTKRSHRHDFYLAVLFTKGSGTHEVDFTLYPVSPGTVFMMAPGQFHYWNLSKDAAGYVFFHSREFYNLNYTTRQIEDYPFFAFTQNTPVVYLDKAGGTEIESLFKQILAEYRRPDTNLKFRKLLTLVDLLYLDLTPLYLTDSSPKTEHSPLYLQKVTELNKLIDVHFRTHKSAGEYADLMNITPKHLNRICREMLGKTTTNLIAERVVLEAKRMLAHSGKSESIKEIADELGFEDSAYFMRLFKKQSGESPSAFIKKQY
jgi:AraC family transcriptional activator of pobA